MWRWPGAGRGTVVGRRLTRSLDRGGTRPVFPGQSPVARSSRSRQGGHRRCTPAPRPPPRRWGPAAVSGAILGLLAVMVAVVPPFILPASSLPVTLGANEVTNWSSYNYEGYQGQASYPEFHSLMQTMAALGKRYGCGRAMWEYSASENRFGTPEALMLLPYETNGCIDSMEGLLFESSATTPYHFLNQAELSAGPSEPEVGLPYGPLNVTLGVQHLQLLGVKYFMAETPQVEQEAAADPGLQLVAKSGPWTYNYGGADTTTTWQIYLVKDSPLVTPLANDPVVLSGVKPGPASWLGSATHEGPALAWYGDPSKWNVELAQGGPVGLAPDPGGRRPPDRQARRRRPRSPP